MKTLTLPISFYSDENDPGVPVSVKVTFNAEVLKHVLKATAAAKQNNLAHAVVIPRKTDIEIQPLDFNDVEDDEKLVECHWPHPSIGPASVEFICYQNENYIIRIFSPNGQYIETEFFSL